MRRDMGKEMVLKKREKENGINLVLKLQNLGCQAGIQESPLRVKVFILKYLKVKNANLA